MGNNCCGSAGSATSPGGGGNSDDPKHYYKIMEEIGSGAFSTVHRAEDKETHEIQALKMIPSAVYQKNKDATEKEISVMEKVAGRNPHIVEMRRVIRGRKHLCIAMEMLTGGELFDEICKREFYTEEDGRKLIAQLVDAIAYLHEHHIAHRDLKPENMIFRSKQPDAPLVVSDFGFAGVDSEGKGFSKKCGTPLYVAPEIVDAHNEIYGIECDMWSVGVITYVILSGYPPFYGEDERELFHFIETADYQFHSPNFDEISAEAKDFISKLLVTDPKQRMTAKEALKHPWLDTAKDQSTQPQLKQTLVELRRTEAKRKLVQGVLAIIALNHVNKVTGKQ